MIPKLALILCCLSVPALAEDALQPVDAIRSAAESAVMAGPGAQVRASIDERLRLPRCSLPLTALPNGSGTVEVACPDPAGWRLYVPVRISRSSAVLVLTRPIAAGMPIPADALGLEVRDVGRLPGAALDQPGLVAGHIARRALAAGSALTMADLALLPVIRRGQSVTLVARSGGLEVRAAGRALADAAPGERLAVENPGSRRVIQGVVQDSGEVLVR